MRELYTTMLTLGRPCIPNHWWPWTRHWLNLSNKCDPIPYPSVVVHSLSTQPHCHPISSLPSMKPQRLLTVSFSEGVFLTRKRPPRFYASCYMQRTSTRSWWLLALCVAAHRYVAFTTRTIERDSDISCIRVLARAALAAAPITSASDPVELHSVLAGNTTMMLISPVGDIVG